MDGAGTCQDPTTLLQSVVQVDKDKTQVQGTAQGEEDLEASDVALDAYNDTAEISVKQLEDLAVQVVCTMKRYPLGVYAGCFQACTGMSFFLASSGPLGYSANMMAYPACISMGCGYAVQALSKAKCHGSLLEDGSEVFELEDDSEDLDLEDDQNSDKAMSEGDANNSQAVEDNIEDGIAESGADGSDEDAETDDEDIDNGDVDDTTDDGSHAISDDFEADFEDTDDEDGAEDSDDDASAAVAEVSEAKALDEEADQSVSEIQADTSDDEDLESADGRPRRKRRGRRSRRRGSRKRRSRKRGSRKRRSRGRGSRKRRSRGRSRRQRRSRRSRSPARNGKSTRPTKNKIKADFKAFFTKAKGVVCANQGKNSFCRDIAKKFKFSAGQARSCQRGVNFLWRPLRKLCRR